MIDHDNDRDELTEEMNEHIRRLTEGHLAAGMSAAEARRAALRQFGSRDLAHERIRAQRRGAWFGDVARDAAFGLRGLRKSPGFTATVVLILGVGIGACTAIFSAVNQVLLRPPPFADPDRVVDVHEVLLARSQELLVTSGKYLDWQRAATSFAETGAFTGMSYNATGMGDPVLLYGTRISASLLPTLGVKPLLGRNFLPSEELPIDQEEVAILSHKLWQQRFGGQSDVVGRGIQLNGRRFTIVGVMARDSAFAQHTDIFTPLGYTARNRANYANPFLRVVARLRPGVTLAQAQGEMNVLAARTAESHPIAKGWGVQLRPLAQSATREARPVLLALLAAVGFLLLIACANVALLLLARVGSRAQEIAVRAALGASRGRIVRQLLVENLLLSGAGGLLGIVIARVGLAVVSALPPDTLPRAQLVSVDGRALAFASLISLGTGLGFGLAPALHSTRARLTEALKRSRGAASGGDRTRLRRNLVTAEIAIALVLLTGAGLLMRSFARLMAVPPGFNPDGALVTTAFLPRPQYDTPEQYAAFAAEVTRRIAADPAVAAVAPATHIPFSDVAETRTFGAADWPIRSPADLPVANHHNVGPDYFRAMGIPLLRGRAFDARDTLTAERVVIINDTIARRFFPNVDPLGRHIDLDGVANRVIVGVVGDVIPLRLDGALIPQIYESFAQSPSRSLTFVVRGAHDQISPDLAATIRAAITGLDPHQPVEGLRPLAHLISDSVARQRFTAGLFAAFAASALFLAALGIYGVMSQAVAQRQGEIGIRIALGAQACDVLQLVLGEGGRLVAVGLLVGTAGALALTHLLGSLLFATSPRDPATFTIGALVLGGSAAVACLLPARRAIAVDPMTTLRSE
jgi:predicted permease